MANTKGGQGAKNNKRRKRRKSKASGSSSQDETSVRNTPQYVYTIILFD